MSRLLKLLNYFLKKFKEISIHTLRILTSPLRVLPDFIVIGAQKAGTTSLFNYLMEHPSIFPPFKKEIQFFDLNYKKGLLWYRSNFPTKIYKYLITKVSSRNFITGEASPYYILYPHAAKRVNSKLNKIKIIILLRNPINRSFSQYFHTIKSGSENLSFKEAIKKEDKRIEGEFEKILKDEDYRSSRFPAFAYLTRSIYINQIEKWFEYFPKNQILVIKSEDLFEKPKETLKLVFKFLNIPNWTKIKYKKYHSEAGGRKIDEETRNYLKEYFKPYNLQLYEYLERDFYWD